LLTLTLPFLDGLSSCFDQPAALVLASTAREDTSHVSPHPPPNPHHHQCGGDAVVFDYFMDDRIVRRGRMDMLELKRYSELKRITLLGARFAARLEAQGAFEKYDLAPLRLGAAGQQQPAAHAHQQQPERQQQQQREEEREAREEEANAQRWAQEERRLEAQEMFCEESVLRGR
jgi:hypothetical protein